MTPSAQRFSDRAHHFAVVLDRAPASAATPCSGWTVTDVVSHVIDTERDFLASRGLDMGDRPAFIDLPVEWRAHASRVAEHLNEPGVAETQYDGFFGPTTVAETMADFYGWDLAIHAWDLARASGQDWQVSEDEVARLASTADGFGPALHSEGICGPEVVVAEGSSPHDQLIARLGRDPQWSPA